MRVASISALFLIMFQSDALPLEPSWPPGPDAVLPKGEYRLAEDTVAAYDTITFQGGTIITTQGHDFDFTVRQLLDIQGTLTIRSFEPSAVPPTTDFIPDVGTTGIPNYHRGPDMDGAAPDGQDAVSGGTGSKGRTGADGTKGYDAGSITLSFEPSAGAAGTLIVSNNGGDGGMGGKGGEGGKGGDGQQGGRCKPFKDPGHGGPGGMGGEGGLGGRGGNGGRGGLIIIKGGSTLIMDWLKTSQLSVLGGRPGKPGIGGNGGRPGLPGFGGRGGRACQGKVGEWMGGDGKSGQNETKGIEGSTAGPDGFVKKL